MPRWKSIKSRRLVANEGGLSVSQVSALARLDRGEASTVAELAALDGVRPQSMAATVAALEGDGLVHRAPDPGDGRRTLLTLTAAGQQRFRGDRSARQEWLAASLRGQFDDDELAIVVTAARLLQRLTEL